MGYVEQFQPAAGVGGAAKEGPEEELVGGVAALATHYGVYGGDTRCSMPMYQCSHPDVEDFENQQSYDAMLLNRHPKAWKQSFLWLPSDCESMNDTHWQYAQCDHITDKLDEFVEGPLDANLVMWLVHSLDASLEMRISLLRNLLYSSSYEIGISRVWITAEIESYSGPRPLRFFTASSSSEIGVPSIASSIEIAVEIKTEHERFDLRFSNDKVHWTTQPDLRFSDCGLNGNYTQNSAYHNNLNTLLSSLSSNMNNYGFYNASIGRNADLWKKKLLVAMMNVCYSILVDQSSVPLRMILCYTCGIRGMPRNPEFNRELKKLVETLRGQAANGDPFRKYASGSATDPNDQTIYALVQCTPDLSPQDCFDCLTNAYGAMATCPCNGNRGSRQIGPRCNFRYQSYRFFKHVASESPPQGKDDKSARTVIIIVVSTVITIILMICTLIILMKMRKRKMQDKIQSRRVDGISTAESLQYDLSTIREATDNFSSSNKLGSGGFGPVYKGVLQSGQEVAVKRLSANSGQGDLEFKNEILLVARLQHRNLVRLLGFCLDGIERLLVYEFVPNASLDKFLFDPVKRRQLNWERRSKIIGGVARGILYLHEDSRLRIIHRDLKASNVLLDAEMNPKISDFGMARLFALDETQGNTSRVAGTYGYMAPEYATRGKFSVKSDVFSFGVLLLEIISGQKNMCSRNEESMEDLLSCAWSNWQQGTPTNLIDPLLRESTGVLVPDIMRYIHIGLLCIQYSIADRPTMAAVVLMLSSASLRLPVLSGPPAYYTRDDITSPEISLIHEAQNQIKFHLEVLDLDVALYSEKPTAITEASSDEEKSYYKHRNRSNRLGLMFMRMNIARNIKTTLPKTESAKELLKLVEESSQTADKSLAGTLMARLKSLGMEVEHNFFVQFIINSLSSEYGPFQMNYNTMKDTWNVHELHGIPYNQTINKNERFVYMGNRVKAPVEAVGTYHLILDTGSHLDLVETFYVPSLSRNLVSLSKLDKTEYSFNFALHTQYIFRIDVPRGGPAFHVAGTDSDYVGCVDTRKSIFGYLFLLAGGAISWKSVKQSVIAAFTMKAEFVACFEATVQVNWLRNFISGLGLVDNTVKLLKIYCDNTAAVFFSKNDKYSKGAKHMKLKYFSVKEEVQKHKVSIEHISTKIMIADP
ncbi:hypothetical protein CQW23_04678 [Capsicum baccatum]|uniref:Uncharacterized protein n=1 Tax=Capsicum baccatum TaxID=33114 RepID=A0A2G2XFB5_CAPBA|nr:hypothetical protein CQW23_04678 [Capsicum baccatum]